MKFSQEKPPSLGALKKKEIHDKKMAEEAVFVEKEGAAHAGPGFVGVKSDDIKRTNPETRNYEEEPELALLEHKPVKQTRKNERQRLGENTGAEKDNLKTLRKQESKIQRSKRGKTGEALHNPKNWGEAGIKPSPMDSLGE